MIAARFTELVAAWLFTYLLHSTLLCAAVALAVRLLPPRARGVAETCWRAGLFVPVLSATIHTAGYIPVPGALDLAFTAVALRTPGATAVTTALVLIAAIRAMKVLVGRRELRRIRCASLANAELAARARALGGPPRIAVSQHQSIVSPFLVARGEICLPTRALAELAPDELDAVLAHEIAHVRRHDHVWLWLVRLVERVLFVQPLNARAARRVRFLAECHCDDWALSVTRRPLALATALARIASWLGAPPACAPAMAPRESPAVRRVRRILDDSVPRLRTPARPVAAALAAAVFAGTVLLAPAVNTRTFGPPVSSLPIATNNTAPPPQVAADAGEPRRIMLTRDGFVAIAIEGDLPVAVLDHRGVRKLVLARDGRPIIRMSRPHTTHDPRVRS
jgi:beta-lactamase regulating signal transducer with metallopeptidase domain